MKLLPAPGPARRLALAQLANSVGDGAFFVTFALFFTRIVGLPAGQFGLGVSIGWVAGLLAGVPLGHFADRRGPRGTAVVLAAATALSVLALLGVRSVPLFVVAMCAYACSQAGLHAARQALLARLIAPALRTETRAYLQSTTNAGLALGAALGGAALWRDTAAAYVSVLAVDAAAFVLAALILRTLPPGTPAAPAAPGTRGSALAVLRDRPYAVITLLQAVLLLNMPLLSWVLPLWIAERTEAPRGMVAAVLVLNTLSVALLQVRVARVVRDVRTGAAAVRRAGLLLFVACLVFALSGGGASPWLATLCLVTAAAVQVAGEMLHSAGSWQLSFDLAPPDRHGQYQGFFSSGVALARMVGPALLTTLVVTWGTPGWFVLGGIFALAAALMVPAARWAQRSTVGAGWRSTSAAEVV
ncbi:MFS transporter [Cryptosporangium arvum]|uniref:MFS transporter n=1 Tax=Cryptosporangium arvum TaxID=80871 RepID=UPI001B804938|nr:MFS transporter [Cryptosporangium arvum]